jgi:hypothetical protein
LIKKNKGCLWSKEKNMIAFFLNGVEILHNYYNNFFTFLSPAIEFLSNNISIKANFGQESFKFYHVITSTSKEAQIENNVSLFENLNNGIKGNSLTFNF